MFQASPSSDATRCSQLSLHDDLAVPDEVSDPNRRTDRSNWSSLHSIKMDDACQDAHTTDDRTEFLKSSPQLVHVEATFRHSTYDKLFKALEVLDDDQNYKDPILECMTQPTKESGYSSVEPIVMTVSSHEREPVVNQTKSVVILHALSSVCFSNFRHDFSDILEFLNHAEDDSYLTMDPDKVNEMVKNRFHPVICPIFH